VCAELPRFDRRFFDGRERLTAIGAGACGGKAAGLIRMRDALATQVDAARHPGVEVAIPRFTVLTTAIFDRFLAENHLQDLARSDEPDARIALAFQQADLPVDLVGDLRALIKQVHTPLAIRSSSLLEDALYRPFAGVYETKMIPNNQPDPDVRFRRLVEAIKFVWASTFFADAKRYIHATEHAIDEEKMAVIIQEVVGRRHRDRFYPDFSGVARSYSFYRFGHARPEEGVLSLALGLGKTIVDEGVAWNCSPAHPKAARPYASIGELLDETQREFWAVNMGKPAAYDPIAETEYLVRDPIAEAEPDGTLRFVASTFDARSDRLSPGVGVKGPRLINFAPLLVLEEWPLAAVVRDLLKACEQVLGAVVEVEFAATIERDPAPRLSLGFLQVRPMVVSSAVVEVTETDLARADAIVASDAVMGNGTVDGLTDIVYVRPERFEARHTPQVAAELAAINRTLAEQDRPYLLIGFGRWGSSDPWLGIPATWAEVAGARAIVEATLPTMNVELSQGSHFFHNISSFEVGYFCVRHDGRGRIDWSWLDAQPAVSETTFVRHIRSARPIVVRVDGRSGRGVVLAGPSGEHGS
jgi:hypothetical protein